jgi:hypothetical protein
MKSLAGQVLIEILSSPNYLRLGLFVTPPLLLLGAGEGEVLEGPLSGLGEVRGVSRTGDSERGLLVGAGFALGLLSRG